MIITYMGTPGSGKSYEAVKVIVDNLKLGRTVYTNIDGVEDPTCREAIRLLTKSEMWDIGTRYIKLSDEQIINKLWTHVKEGGFVVIDEIHKYFSNRDWNTEKNKGFCNWAKEHRHHGIDILMLTTSIDGVDSQVRNLSEWTYDFRKINYFGSAVKNKYEIGAHIGESTGGKPYQKWIKSYDHKIFRCYKSYVSKDIKELGIQKHVNILKHPIFFILPVLLIFAVYMLSKSSIFGGGFFGVVKKSTEAVSAKKPVPVVAPVLGKSNIVEYRDLVKKEAKDRREGLPPVAAVPPVVVKDNGGGDGIDLGSCIVRGVVSLEDKVIQLEDCQGRYVHRVNGSVTHISHMRGQHDGKRRSMIAVAKEMKGVE